MLRVYSFLLVGFLFFPVRALAESPTECKARLKDEVQCFIGGATYHHMRCSLHMKLALSDASQFDNARACIVDARTEVEEHYKAASRKLRNRKAATETLKSTYAYWMTAIGQLAPKGDELRPFYVRRLAEQDRELNERLNRLSLE